MLRYLTKSTDKTIKIALSKWPFSPGRIVQSVICLTADLCLTADPGVVSSILAQCLTFVEIDHEIISMAILLPSADSRRVIVSYKRKYVHEVLVNRFVKLAQRPDMTIAVDWDVKKQTK